MWSKGSLKIGNHIIHYWVKHYEQGSQYGIENEGRISKLMLKKTARSLPTTTGVGIWNRKRKPRSLPMRFW
jgi:hypothetical protein